MRRGCIAIMEVTCDGCKRTIRYGERYLADDGQAGGIVRLCFDCCAKKGMVAYKRERGQEIMTLFGESLELPPEPTAGQSPAKAVKEKRAKSKGQKTVSEINPEGGEPDA